MTEVVLERRGTIDKYMGDCIMAFWNAPLDNPAHAVDACAKAVPDLRPFGEAHRVACLRAEELA